MAIYQEQDTLKLRQAIDSYEAWEAEQDPNAVNKAFAHGARERKEQRVIPIKAAKSPKLRQAIESGFAFENLKQKATSRR